MIVTADDFGLSQEVNEAVEAAHREGILTSASLMIGAPAAADAVARARRLPSLHVGLHLTLLEGEPVLPRAEVAALLDASGRLRSHPLSAALAVFFRPAARRQLAREIAAQFTAFQASGLPLDHVNTHKHFHVHPTVGRAVIDIGRRFGMRAVRVPQERTDILSAIAGKPARRPAANRGPWAGLLRARLARQGLRTSDYCFGETWTGAMTEDRLAGLLARLPAGVTEIYCHPASSGRFSAAVPSFRYADELAALLSPRIAALTRGGSIKLAGFSDLSETRLTA